MTPDAVFTFANMDVFWLLLAFAGGAFAAMIGPNFAFAFTGVSILVGFSVTAATGNTMFLDYISFGPVFGPHIRVCRWCWRLDICGQEGPATGRSEGH